MKAQFTLRDLLWLVVVAGIGIAWWVDRSRLIAGIGVLTNHIYTNQGLYPHWNDRGQMIITDK